MFIFPAASAPDSCLYCSLLADGWSAEGSEGGGGVSVGSGGGGDGVGAGGMEVMPPTGRTNGWLSPS